MSNLFPVLIVYCTRTHSIYRLRRQPPKAHHTRRAPHQLSAVAGTGCTWNSMEKGVKIRNVMKTSVVAKRNVRDNAKTRLARRMNARLHAGERVCVSVCGSARTDPAHIRVHMPSWTATRPAISASQLVRALRARPARLVSQPHDRPISSSAIDSALTQSNSHFYHYIILLATLSHTELLTNIHPCTHAYIYLVESTRWTLHIQTYSTYINIYICMCTSVCICLFMQSSVNAFALLAIAPELPKCFARSISPEG